MDSPIQFETSIVDSSNVLLIHEIRVTVQLNLSQDFGDQYGGPGSGFGNPCYWHKNGLGCPYSVNHA